MVKPIVLAILLSDSVIREQGTNKLSLIGTFNGLFSNTYPCTHPTMSVYIAITEGRGRVPCRLRMIGMEDNSTVFDLPGQIDFGGPTSVGELVFQLQQVRFPNPGVYSIEFWTGNDLLASRKLNVQKVEQKNAE
ncbi:MAG: hypothetical protein WCT04_19665 [Planctomycetota bacterium]